MEIKVMEIGAFATWLFSGQAAGLMIQDQATSNSWEAVYIQDGLYNHFHSAGYMGGLFPHDLDPKIAQLMNTQDFDEYKALAKEINNYAFAQHAKGTLAYIGSLYYARRPWLRNGNGGLGLSVARCWVDQDLKKELGY